VSPSAQDDFSNRFSEEDKEVDTIGPNTQGVTLHGTDGHGINYDYSAEWVDGCVTTVPEQSFGFPIGSPSLITAYLLVREDFTKCEFKPYPTSQRSGGGNTNFFQGVFFLFFPS
jgi:hypothetical protein